MKKIARSTAMDREHQTRSPASAAQLVTGSRMQSAIDNSPRAAAQRAQLRSAFGNAVQLEAMKEKPPQAKASHEVLQQQSFAEEESLHVKFTTLPRKEDDELLQGKFSSAFIHAPVPDSFAIQRQAASPDIQENHTGMPNQLKAGIESLSGMDMSEVRVHRNSDKPARLNALAYAQGNDIHLGAGQEQHLPHEAWHVVQQHQGRVQETMQMQGVGINDDAGLESEADAMGAKANSIVV